MELTSVPLSERIKFLFKRNWSYVEQLRPTAPDIAYNADLSFLPTYLNTCMHLFEESSYYRRGMGMEDWFQLARPSNIICLQA